MALRHFMKKFRYPAWWLTSFNLNVRGINTLEAGHLKSNISKPTVLPFPIDFDKPHIKPETVIQKTEPHQANKVIDLFTNNAYKRFYMPTITINTLKVYQDSNESRKSIEDNRVVIKKIDPLPSNLFEKKAVRMIRIRRRKMKKHQRKRFRKKYKFLLAKIKLKRELKKEQAFRAELLSQVEAADKFDAKEYVSNILHTLRYHPKPETEKERKEKYRIKYKMHRYQTTFVRPNFDDD